MKDEDGKKVHVLNSTTYEEEVDGYTMESIVKVDPPKKPIPRGKIWHAILGRPVPEDWAEKEMWVDKSETILA